MFLASVINVYEDLLICDLAQTYQIFDYKKLPARVVASFVYGLDQDSRIKMALSNRNFKTSELLLASVVDRLSLLVWSKTKDGLKGKNRPKMLVDLMINNKPQNEVIAFSSIDDFEARKKEILNKVKGGE